MTTQQAVQALDALQEIELKTFNVAGVKYRPADVIAPLGDDETIRLVAEPENAYDVFAIRVECRFVYEVSSTIPEDSTKDPQSGEDIKWELIGYVPKKETWIFHVMRKAGVKLSLKLFVNHDARDEDKLLVKVTYLGNPDARFV